jgi:membrane dipeptidase
MVRHLDHLIERLGEDKVGFGSDFDGTIVPSAIKDAAGLPRLVAALRAAGYDEPLLRKLAFENWLRALERIWAPEPPRAQRKSNSPSRAVSST